MAAQVKAARDNLDKCVTTFNYAKKVLAKIVSSDTVNERTLVNKMSKADEALEELNMAHTTWVSRADLPDDQLNQDKYSPSWLETLWDEYSDLQSLVDDKLSKLKPDTAPPVRTNDQKLQIWNKQMETLQLDIHTKISELTTRFSNDLAQGSVKVYSEMLSSVKDNLGAKFLELMDSILSGSPEFRQAFAGT